MSLRILLEYTGESGSSASGAASWLPWLLVVAGLAVLVAAVSLGVAWGKRGNSPSGRGTFHLKAGGNVEIDLEGTPSDKSEK